MSLVRNNYKVLFILLLAILMIGCNKATTEPQDSSNLSETESPSNEQVKSNYPERNIEMVVGYGAGGGTDNFARAIAKELEDILDVKINVVNKSGSSGAIATEYVLSQPGDGYTILAIPDYPVTVAVGANPHGLENFKPIARIQKDTMTIQVKGDGLYADIHELFQAAKDNPGRITIGGVGAASIEELAVQQMNKELDIQFNFVPYDDSAQMHAALLGGHIDSIMEEIGPTIGSIQEGLIKILLVWNEERLKDFPDVPTSVENGWNLTDGMSRGIIAHKDTPDEIIKILEDALEQAKDRPGYKEYEESNYLHLNPGWKGSEDYQQELEEQIKSYSEAVTQ